MRWVRGCTVLYEMLVLVLYYSLYLVINPQRSGIRVKVRREYSYDWYWYWGRGHRKVWSLENAFRADRTTNIVQ